ncbi:MAG: hypothetical protein RL283_75 [Actinomycetota bacterium]
MGFFAAICSCVRNYATFRGRASRAEYWWWTLFVILAELATSSLGDAVGNVAAVVLILPSIAVAVRRMHDTDHRGWWQLVPIVNLVFALRRGDAGENRFGPPPPPAVR